ncbi:DUF2306 domain-containing protein [Devosia sp. LjRoot3]|uniref:DUF2306 domain-containing protein n=1 Tax=Devosia sp. LjRoot3 TaxID=3342319 RepID=UPI003ECF6DE8
MLASTLRTGLIWFLCLGIAIASWRFLWAGVESSMGHVAYHADLRPIAFYTHVVLAPAALALVPFQLWNGLRASKPGLHRLLGRAYGIAIVLSGLSGLWLALTTEAGAVAAWGFGLLAIAWLATTIRGIGLAMQGDRLAHRRWMIRSIALTLAAVSLRLQVFATLLLDLPFDTAYSAIAWLCWVPNLIVAELVLRRGTSLRLRAA